MLGGKATFVKRLYNQQGLTGARDVRPIRYAKVEVVLAIDGHVVSSGYTDVNGNYCMQVRNVPADFPTVYPRVVSRTDPKRFNLAVVDDIQSPQWSLYSWAGGEFNGTVPGVFDRDMAVPVTAQLAGRVDFPIAGAFNILDVAVRGAEAAVAMAGRPPTAELVLGWTPGTAFGSGTVGTYFVADDPTATSQALAGIELSGGEGGGPDEGDHDEYDDDVILHEFGHFMSYSFSKAAEAGGPHYLNDNAQDIRLAWSEGWATFFSAAVRDRERLPRSSYMVNSRGGDPDHPDHPDSYSFEIETPHSDLLTTIGTPLETHGVYTTSEVAVAAVLWDLYDGSNEPGDRFAMGLEGVWDVFERMIAAPANVSLETFEDYFARSIGPLSLASTGGLRRMQFVPDQYETRDNAPTVNAPPVAFGEVTCHTLFPEGDVDHVRFSVATAGTVKIETFNLSNGADTVVELLNEQGVLVSGEDATATPRESLRGFERTGCGNRERPTPPVYMAGINNGVNFSSTVGPLSLTPGVYYVKVMSAGPARNPSAGVLGSYDLVVTLQ
ncbi:MAG: hypothetical protein ACOYXR_02025 [Nitrospirota bacterium]